MDKYGCFMQMYVYYYWNHSQHRAWSVGYSCFKGHRCFSKNLFMSIRHIKKKHQVPITSLFALSNYLHNPVYIFAWQGSSSSEHTPKLKTNVFFFIRLIFEIQKNKLPALIMYLIQQWCIKLIKSNKGIYIISKFCILDTFSFELYIHQMKYIIVSTKILSSTTVFDNNNKKCFLSTKSAYYNVCNFWRIMRHWRLWCHIN